MNGVTECTLKRQIIKLPIIMALHRSLQNNILCNAYYLVLTCNNQRQELNKKNNFMKKIFTLLAVLGIVNQSNTVFAQNPASAKVTGEVAHASKKIENASVSLLKAKDSSVVKMSISSTNGEFLLEKIAAGKYLVLVQSAGFAKYYSELFDLTSTGFYAVKKVELVASSKNLGDVSVTSRKPLIEQKADRTIVNVEASVTNVGNSALEVLEKSPGVSVDKDGNISLKGKAGVQIFIDGRPAYVSGQDLTNMLRNMQSNQLETIEIMTNPPAKYDAAGNAGIINLKTKKSKAFGFNGTVSVGFGQGIYSKFNENINLNYRKNKLNFFGSLSHNYRRNIQELSISRKFINSGSKQVESLFDQTNYNNNENQSYNGKIGLDYFASKKTTIGAVVSSFYNPGDFWSIGKIDIANPSGILQRQTYSESRTRNKWKNISTNFNFRHVIDSTGKEITADLDYLNYDVNANLRLKSDDFNALNLPIAKPDTLYGQLPQRINIYTARVDYSMPLKGGAKFEAGLKFSFVETDANAIYDSLKYGNIIRDNNRSNHFIYKENIHAAYINYNKPFSKKLSAQFGLRVEQTIAKGNQLGNSVVAATSFKRNYAQLFPTAYLQYAANEKNSYVLNYGRRIRRPDYESLNPFIEFLDRYTFEQGNPNLQPQFSHNIELSHTYKGFLTTTVNYTNTNNIIQQVLEQNTAKNETFVKQANIAKQEQVGLSVNAFNQYTKIWSGNIYVNVFHNKFSGLINNELVTIDATSLQGNISQQFKFKKGWAAELGGFYRTESIDGIFRINGFGAVNMGISKQIMKSKGSVRLNVRDVFWSQRVKGSSRFGDIDAAFRQYQDSRVINLSFTYRFNKGKLKASSQRKVGGASDEASRVGGSN